MKPPVNAENCANEAMYVILYWNNTCIMGRFHTLEALANTLSCNIDQLPHLKNFIDFQLLPRAVLLGVFDLREQIA